MNKYNNRSVLCDRYQNFITGDLDIVILAKRPNYDILFKDSSFNMGYITTEEFNAFSLINKKFTRKIEKLQKTQSEIKIIQHGPLNRLPKISLNDLNFPLKIYYPIVKGSIDFDLIEQHYDEILEITAALKYKKTTADSITRQFNATNYQSSLFKAFRELGRAQRSIFLCKYLSDENLRAEISAGLNITENWNSMAKAIHYADNIDIRSNDVTEQEVSILCVHFLQLCIVYLNFLLIQNLANDDDKLKLNISASDSITPTFYFHINLYGAIDLSFNSKLNI